MAIFVNLTPHPIRLRANATNLAAEPDPTDIVIDPRRGEDGKPTPARVPTTPGQSLPPLAGIATYGRTTYSQVEGLPPPVAGTVYLVSVLFAGRTERDDLFIPGTGPQDKPVRNDEGQVFAVTRLVQA